MVGDGARYSHRQRPAAADGLARQGQPWAVVTFTVFYVSLATCAFGSRHTQNVLNKGRGLAESMPDLNCSVHWNGRLSSNVSSGRTMGPYEWNRTDQDKCDVHTDVVAQSAWSRTTDVQNGIRLYNVTLTCTCSESAASSHPDGCYDLAQWVLYSWWTGPPWMQSLGHPSASERPELWVDLEVAKVNCSRTVCSNTVIQQRPPYAQYICYNASLDTIYGIVEAAETTPKDYDTGEVNCTATLYQFDAPRSVLYGKGAMVSVNITGSTKQPGACVNYTSNTTPFDERATFTNWGYTLSLECICAASKSGNSSCYRLAQNVSAYFDFTPNIAIVPLGSNRSRVLTIYPWDCTASSCLTSTDLYLEHRPKPNAPLLYAHALCYNQDGLPTGSTVPPPQVSLQCDVELTPHGVTGSDPNSVLRHTDRYPEIDFSNQTGRCIVRSDMAKANGRTAYGAGRRNRTAELTDYVTLKQYIRNVSTEIYGVDLKFTCHCGYRTSSGEIRGGEGCYQVAKYATLSMWDGPLWRQKETVMLPTVVVGGNTSTGRPITFSPSNCTDTNCSLSYALQTAPYASALCMGVWPYQPKGLDLLEPTETNVTKCTLHLYERVGSGSASGKQTFEVTNMGSCVMTTNDTTSTAASTTCIPKSSTANITAGECGSWGSSGHLFCICEFNSSNCFRAAKSVKWFYMLQVQKERQCTTSNTSIQFEPWQCTAGTCVTSAYVGPTDNITNMTGHNLGSNSSFIIYSQKLCNGNEPQAPDCPSHPLTFNPLQPPSAFNPLQPPSTFNPLQPSTPEPPSPSESPSPPKPPSPPALPGTPIRPYHIDNNEKHAVDINFNVVVYSVGSTVGVSFVATITALAAYSSYVSSGLSRTTSTTMPLISMLQNVQFIVILGGATGDSSSLSGKLAKELGWANFRFGVISSNNKGGPPPGPPAGTYAAPAARSLLQSSGGNSGRHGVQQASNGNMIQDRINVIKTDAYDQLLNASYVSAGIVALHWLIFRLLRWGLRHRSAKSAKGSQDQGSTDHQVKTVVLPPILVFPCLEIQLLEVTYGAACQAAGSLAAASYLLSGAAAPTAVSVISFVYLGIVLAVMMSLVWKIAHLWKRPNGSKAGDLALPGTGGRREMLLTYIPASKTSNCFTWWGCHGGDDASSGDLPLADQGAGAAGASGSGPQKQAQPPPTMLRRLLDGLVKMCELCELPNEWKKNLDAGSWDDPGGDEEVLGNMHVQSERTRRYLRTGMSLRAIKELFSIARCRYRVQELLNPPLPRTYGHRWLEGLLDAPAGNENQLDNGAAANRSGGGELIPAAGPTALPSGALKRKDGSSPPPSSADSSGLPGGTVGAAIGRASAISAELRGPPWSAASAPQQQSPQPEPSRANRSASALKDGPTLTSVTTGGSNAPDLSTSSHVGSNPRPGSNIAIAQGGPVPEGSIPFCNITRMTPHTETDKSAPKQKETQDESSMALFPSSITIIASSRTGTGGLQQPSEGRVHAPNESDRLPVVSVLYGSGDPPAQDTEVSTKRRAWQLDKFKMNTEGWTRMQLYERFGYYLTSYKGDSLLSVTFHVTKTFANLVIYVLVATVDGLKAENENEVCRSGACVGLLSSALAVKTAAVLHTLFIWPFINQYDGVMELIISVLQAAMLASKLAISRGSSDDKDDWEEVILGCATASTVLQGLALVIFVVIPASPQMLLCNPLKAMAECLSIWFGVQSLDIPSDP